VNIRRIMMLAARELRLGPRTPFFLFALLMPLVLTFLLQVVFLTLLSPRPRLAVADLGASSIPAAVEGMADIDLIRASDLPRLRELVERHDVDAGLLLESGFDRAVRAGEKPRLVFFVSGESRASNRILLAVTALDLVRGVEGARAPVEVVLHSPGRDEVPPLSERLVPSVLLFALLVAGIFVPAFSLVTEREQGTLHALLVTPVRMIEVMLSKSLVGLLMVLVMAFVTLALNGALGGEGAGLLLSLLVGGVMCVEIGMIYATLAPDGKTLYTLIKTLNVILAGPVIFYLFPSWPQWIARIFPTWWFIDPVYRISMRGASFSEVAPDLAVAMGICLALIPPLLLLGRRLQTRLAAA